MDTEITASLSRKHRVFRPIILFHDHRFIEDGRRRWERVPVGDPTYGQMIEERKQATNKMLWHNEQFWAGVRGFEVNNNGDDHVDAVAQAPWAGTTAEEHPSPSSDHSAGNSGSQYHHHGSRHCQQDYSPRSLAHARQQLAGSWTWPPFINSTTTTIPTATAGSVGISDNVSVSSSSIPPSPVSPTAPYINSNMHHIYMRSTKAVKKQPPSGPPTPPANHSTTTTTIATAKKRRRGNLPKAVTAILRDWLAKHKNHPYPTEEEKAALARQTSLTMNQISNWFINARRRILQPMLQKEQRQRMLYSTSSSAHRDASSRRSSNNNEGDDAIGLLQYDDAGSTQTQTQWQSNMALRRADYASNMAITRRRRSTLRQR